MSCPGIRRSAAPSFSLPIVTKTALHWVGGQGTGRRHLIMKICFLSIYHVLDGMFGAADTEMNRCSVSWQTMCLVVKTPTGNDRDQGLKSSSTSSILCNPGFASSAAVIFG